ncbi:MAG: hypothetical protein ACLQSR_16085 [Limisphaerales bacterium]
METKRLVTAIVAVAFSSLTALGQDYNKTPNSPPPSASAPYSPSYSPPNNAPEAPAGIFQGNELQLDLFGTASVNEQILKNISGQRITRNGRLGAGGGLTYYPIRYLGVGGDVYSENTRHRFINDSSGNLYLRLPFDAVHLAPYIYGGAGYQFEPGEAWFGQAGAGLDIRVTHHWGLFVDGRYVMPSRHEENFGMGRAGIRLVF